MLVLTVKSGGEPVAFAQLARDGQEAEITEVYVDRRHRDRGLGTALTRAAIAAAGEVENLWICADERQGQGALHAAWLPSGMDHDGVHAMAIVPAWPFRSQHQSLCRACADAAVCSEPGRIQLSGSVK